LVQRETSATTPGVIMSADRSGHGDPEGGEPGAPRVLVVTPTYNEANNLNPFAEALFDVLPTACLLVVDDASPDGTGSIADALAARDQRVSCLHRPAKLGLGTAYVEGFQWGLSRGFDLFFEMDADLSHDPAHLPSFLRAFDEGADVVVGSRNIPGGGVVGWGLGRTLLSKGGSLYARAILGVPIHDLTTGYKGYTRRALEAIDITRLKSNGYSFQIETTYRALARGLDVREVPIVFTDRRAGESKMSRRIVLEAIGIVWRLRLSRSRLSPAG
jgi:dolichol-phosphate mannosyltransferase